MVSVAGMPAIQLCPQGMGGLHVQGEARTWRCRGGAEIHTWPGSVNGTTQFAGVAMPWSLSADSTNPWSRKS